MNPVYQFFQEHPEYIPEEAMNHEGLHPLFSYDDAPEGIQVIVDDFLNSTSYYREHSECAVAVNLYILRKYKYGHTFTDLYLEVITNSDILGHRFTRLGSLIHETDKYTLPANASYSPSIDGFRSGIPELNLLPPAMLEYEYPLSGTYYRSIQTSYPRVCQALRESNGQLQFSRAECQNDPELKKLFNDTLEILLYNQGYITDDGSDTDGGEYELHNETLYIYSHGTKDGYDRVSFLIYVEFSHDSSDEEVLDGPMAYLCGYPHDWRGEDQAELGDLQHSLPGHTTDSALGSLKRCPLPLEILYLPFLRN